VIVEVASSVVLDTAFAWLCKRRIDYADSADVWNVRRRWPELKLQLQRDLLHGQYRFSPLRRIQIDGECIELWAALDALVLKALALVLNRRLDFPKSCYHVPGKAGEEKRGAKAAVRHICCGLPSNQFVFRSDIKRYYASIDHAVLLTLVRDSIDDPLLLDLVAQYLHRTVDENCLYSTVTVGISLGCPLSPVMAAIYLEPLDRRMEATGLTYARFMDDWVILAPTRWRLRRAIRIVNETLCELRVEQHPDKTFIGRIDRGFTFLRYWITEKGVTGVAPSAWERFQERVVRLYEQDAPPEEIRRRIGQYVRRWKQWVVSGVREVRGAFEWPDVFPGHIVVSRLRSISNCCVRPDELLSLCLGYCCIQYIGSELG
jgi:retron-type reverse transcriptase